MVLLAALVERGGRPAAVSPTVRLRPGEKQYGWLPADVAGDGRRVVVITDQRIIAGDREWSLRGITRVETEPAEWAVTLWMRGRPAPVVLSGPWVPWLGVVICAELYSEASPLIGAEPGSVVLREMAFPPGGEAAVLPGQRRPTGSVDPDLGLQRQRVVVPQPVHRGDRHPGATV
jgi:hypothetical protein